jgi:hypothetical protein
MTDSAPHIEVQLTQGNLSHDHVYLRAHLDFFPADAIGAPNARNGTGALLTLPFKSLPEPRKDRYHSRQKMLRCRSP